MQPALRLSIDAMGGDNAPLAIVEGVDLFAKSSPGTRFLLHGDNAELEPLLKRFKHARASSDIFHADHAIAMDAKPSQAVRRGKGSSMWNAIEAVKRGEADAAVSAGNTGALMAMAKLVLRTVQGVHRPAIAASWPTPKGMTVVLDVGANIEADAEQLVEFAIMGEAFARAVHGKSRPSVGLLNIGSEDLKGHDEIRLAAQLIRDCNVDLDFRGFVEGNDISLGAVDVVVTDGFTGNIALKTAEGTARLVGMFLKEAFTAGPLERVGALFALPALNRLKLRMDPRTSNGGVFLGLNGVVVKSHGGTDAKGFAHALKVAQAMGQSSFMADVGKGVERFLLAEEAKGLKAELDQGEAV
jgi:glycerol-3-phosphate acyltransferase PlsX